MCSSLRGGTVEGCAAHLCAVCSRVCLYVCLCLRMHVYACVCAYAHKQSQTNDVLVWWY